MMRRARITFQGAFHHAMNRGYEGKAILKTRKLKDHFIELLSELAKLFRIRIFAYCLMPNHYHLVLENTSDRMSDFFKRLNGEFGFFYRRVQGGRGYVFQDRYKSTVIQDESYLMIVIAYVLNNPVRAELIDDFLKYDWSSAGKYFKGYANDIVDCSFVEDIFESSDNFINFVNNWKEKELPLAKSREGLIIGGEEFYNEAREKADRRRNKADNLNSKRIEDNLYFYPKAQIIQSFEKEIGMNIEEINTRTIIGKRLRSRLLIYLREQCGLKYDEISRIPLFSDIKFNSLMRIYYNAKKNSI